MTNEEAFALLDESFRRYKITKDDMPKSYVIEGSVYLGMGQSMLFVGVGHTFSEAVDMVIEKWKDLKYDKLLG